MHLLTDRKKMVFLAHWVETPNWLLNFRFFQSLHNDLGLARRWYWLYPVFVIMSIVYLVGSRAYSAVDRFAFKDVAAETWLLRNFGWHFVMPLPRFLNWVIPRFTDYVQSRVTDRIRQRIYRAVRAAKLAGVDILGLGALIKAEWVTRGGLDIVLNVPRAERPLIVHGDTMTAAIVIEQALALLDRFEARRRGVFLTGSTSKTGRAIAIGLAKQGIPVFLYSQDEARVKAIQTEAGSSGDLMYHAKRFTSGQGCALWITGKADKARELLDNLPFGVMVLNFSVPDPLTPRLLRRRPDVIHLDGGLAGYDRDVIPIRFTMRLKYGITYGCHCGTMVHTLEDWGYDEVGPIDLKRVPTIWQTAQKHGFHLPPWTSHMRPVVLPLSTRVTELAFDFHRVSGSTI